MDRLLQEWGMPEYIQKFEEEGLTPDILPVLLTDAGSLEMLVPRLGPRLTLIRQIRTYIQENQNDTSVNESTEVETDFHEKPELGETVTTDVTVLNSELFEFENYSTGGISTEDFESFTVQTDSEESDPKRLKSEPRSLKVCVKDFNLKSLLESSAIGQGLLNWYLIKGSFDGQRQSYLVDIIVTEFLNNGVTHLTTDEYATVSEKIVDLFPNDIKELYYVPPVKKRDSITNKPGLPKGKLVDKFKNKLTFLRESGTLPSRSKETKEETGQLPTKKEDLLWLRHNREPLEEVYHHWDELFTTRRQQFLKEGGSLKDTYLEYPILKESIGLSLVERDFGRIFDEKSQCLYSQWDIATNKLIKLRKQYVTVDSDKLLIDLLEADNLDEDYKNFIKLNLVPALLPNRCRHVVGKSRKTWKPTITESRNGILLKVNICGDIEPRLAERRQKLSNLEVQFHPCVIVEVSGTEIVQTYVYIENTLYKVPSILKAIDICFKTYHTFHLRYQIESEHIWMFIQHRMYNIKTKWDNNIPTILDIVNKTK